MNDAAGADQERAGGLNFRTVWLGIAALFVLAGVAAVVGYFVFLRYERVALKHVPADVTAVARLDLERIVVFEPVRAYALPLLEELGPAHAPLSPRLDRFRLASGIKLTLELRELVWAAGPGLGDWLLVIGGKFAKGRAVPGLKEVFAAEGWGWQQVGEHLELPGGVAFGQAADGTMILASSRARLEQALPATGAFRELEATKEAAGGFFLRRPTSPLLAAGLDAAARLSLTPGARSLARWTSLRAVLDSSFALRAELGFEAGTPIDEAREALQRLLRSAGSAGSLLGVEELGLLERADVVVAGPDVLRVAMTSDKEALELVAKRAAEAVRANADTP